jgi:hypothetical protein
MGFFSSLFKKKEVSTVSDDGDPEKRVAELRRTPKSLIKKFEDYKTSVLAGLDVLEGADFKEEIDLRLRKMIDGSRKAFVNKIRVNTTRLETKSNLKEFKEDLAKFLEICNKEMNRYSARIAIGLEKELRNFSSKMSKFNELMEKIEDTIDRNSRELDPLVEELEKERALKKAGQDQKNIGKELERVVKSIAVKKKYIESAKGELKNLESGEKASKQSMLEKDLNKLESDRKRVLSQIKEFKTGVEKGLRDYMRGIEKTAMHRAIKEFLDSPEDLKDVELLSKAVLDMESMVKKGNTGLSGKKKNKFLKAARTDIKSLFEELDGVKREIVAKKEGILVLKFSSMQSGLRSRIKDLESDIVELKSSEEVLKRSEKEIKKVRLELRNES